MPSIPAFSDRILPARIIAIGDELLLGRTVDSNSAQVARWLSDRGFRVERVEVCGDGQQAIERAMREHCSAAALTVVTGGLGPTDDDRTRHALAAVMGEALVARPAAWKQIERWYRSARPDLAIPQINRRQALFPRSAQMLANDRGTAPGMLAHVGTGWIVCLPGVPHEMQAMLEGFGKQIARLFPGLKPPVIAEVWFAGIGESAAQELIGDLLSEQHPQVGITVNELGHITVRVLGTATLVRARVKELCAALAPYLLPAAGIVPSLVQVLRRKRMTIAAAESCTCGHVAAQIGAVPGASHILRESLIAYHEQVKIDRLEVDPAIIARHGVVSEACAVAMAIGMRRLANADVAIATTGIAGPDGGSAAVPVGTVCIAVADRHGVIAKTTHVSGTRERVQRRAAASALLSAWEVVSDRTATLRPSR